MVILKILKTTLISKLSKFSYARYYVGLNAFEYTSPLLYLIFICETLFTLFEFIFSVIKQFTNSIKFYYWGFKKMSDVEIIDYVMSHKELSKNRRDYTLRRGMVFKMIEYLKTKNIDVQSPFVEDPE